MPETCLEKENNAAYSIRAQGRNLILAAEFNNSDACIEEMKAAARIQAQAETYDLFIADQGSSVESHVTCSQDVSAFNGAGSERFNELFTACGNVEASGFHSVASALLFIVRLENNKLIEEQNELEWEYLQMDPEGGGCVESWTGDKVQAGDCVIGYYSKDSTSPFVDYLYARSSNLQATRGSSEWYDSGSWTAAVNNWDGTVSYNGGDTLPSFKFSNGTTEKSGFMEMFPTLQQTKLERRRDPYQRLQFRNKPF